MRQSFSHTIGEYNYEISQLGAKDGRLVLARIFRSVGKVVAAASGDGTPEAAIAAFAESLTDADLEFVCDKFAKCTQVGQGDKRIPLESAFDAHFAGKYVDMLKWLWHSLQANFGSFLDEAGITPDMLAKVEAKAMSSIRTGLTPQSGDSSSKESPASPK